MVKFKTTERELKGGYKNIIAIGYCEADALLRFNNPIAYTCGRNGWKSDIYQINYNTIISTGYAPIGDIRNYNLTKELNEKAKRIIYNYNLSYEEREEKVKKILNEYVNTILEGSK